MKRFFQAAVVVALLGCVAPGAGAAPAEGRAEQAIEAWYRMVLELVRHTPTYSPPVASRAFAYLGVTAYEAVAGGRSEMTSLAGQLNGLSPPPARTESGAYDDGVVIHAALAFAAGRFFANTGPAGQRAMKALEGRLDQRLSTGLAADVLERSRRHGIAVGAHVVAWSLEDGGATVENLGFPQDAVPDAIPGRWVPTSLVALQQRPLLPRWGMNRTFAVPDGTACPLPPPPGYSEDPASPFYREALEVYETARTLGDEQRARARFWSDDPMLSPTPPGHWVSIALQVLRHEAAPVEERVDVLARLGVALADAFIACWHAKYVFDLVRPITYIRLLIDPAWQPLLVTPPFPEYPSGHSVQSAAAAVVLARHFGESYAFEDATHEADGLPARRFESFWRAAEEAAISRLYGGIHFRAAIERGLEQGRCIGAHAAALRTRH